MKTWSIAGVADRVWDVLSGLERVTRPSRLGHDVDVVDGAEWLAEREAEEEVSEPRPVPVCTHCGKRLGEVAAASNIVAGQFCSARCCQAAEVQYAEVPNPYEPSLSDSELVAVRELIQQRRDGADPNYLEEVGTTISDEYRPAYEAAKQRKYGVETGHDMGARLAAEMFPQYSKSSTAVQCSGSVEHPAGSLTHSPKESSRPVPSSADLLDAAECVRFWSEADTCDDSPANIARLHALADRLEVAAGGEVLMW